MTNTTPLEQFQLDEEKRFDEEFTFVRKCETASSLIAEKSYAAAILDCKSFLKEHDKRLLELHNKLQALSKEV